MILRLYSVLLASQRCKAEDNKNMKVRRRQRDTNVLVHQNQQQPQQRDEVGVEATATATACRHKSTTNSRQRARQKIRYNGPCGYYICYTIFVSIVGLAFLVVLLTLHLARCLLVVTGHQSVYDCFIGLRLDHTQQRSGAAATSFH